MTIAKEYLGHFNHDENKFSNCIVTGDEMWVSYAEPETKAQSKHGNLPHLPRSYLHLLARFCWLLFGIHME